MTITVSLKPNPFSKTMGESNDLSIAYFIEGTDDADEAAEALRQEAPPRAGSMYLKDWKVRPFGDAEDLWEGDAIYQPQKPSDEPTVSIEINTAAVKFTQSLMTVGAYAASGYTASVSDFQGGINVTKDSVDGCDVNVPAMTWNEKHFLKNGRVTRAYISTIFNCVARMNDSPFRIFARGEALFMGGTLAQANDRSGWDFNPRWVGSPNADNLSVGPITVTQKLGHDYLWIRYIDKPASGALAKLPQKAFVERVYQFANYGALQLEEPAF